MLPSTPQDHLTPPPDYSYTQERESEGSIKRQIQHEEFKFKEAIRADKNFEEVKAIRSNINDLKRLKEKIEGRNI